MLFSYRQFGNLLDWGHGDGFPMFADALVSVIKKT
jgi:hypothetical protein